MPLVFAHLTLIFFPPSILPLLEVVTLSFSFSFVNGGGPVFGMSFGATFSLKLSLKLPFAAPLEPTTPTTTRYGLRIAVNLITSGMPGLCFAPYFRLPFIADASQTEPAPLGGSGNLPFVPLW